MFKFRKTQSLSSHKEQFDTLIGQSTQVMGRIVLGASIRIDGKVTGNIESLDGQKVTVAVGSTGEIIGDISAHRVVLAGKVEGNVHAFERVEFFRDAVIQGDVTYGSIGVEHGARLLGQMIHRPSEASTVPETQADQLIRRAQQRVSS